MSAYRDALGNDTTVAYDRYRLLPVTVTEPARLTRQVEYDYRVLQPRLATDPNGCRTLLAYTPLGLVERVALLGRDGAGEGDTA